MIFRVHAIRRMFERRITPDDVRDVLKNGQPIEAYPDNAPYSSQLILGYARSRPLHIVATDAADDQAAVMITAYEPDPELWEDDFKERNQR